MSGRKTKIERLQAIEQKLAELLAKKRSIESEQTAVQRRERNHRCVILGAWLVANEPDQVERIKAQLTRPQDRAAFGLPPVAMRNEQAPVGYSSQGSGE